jgi:Beta-lactamase enzyme family
MKKKLKIRKKFIFILAGLISVLSGAILLRSCNSNDRSTVPNPNPLPTPSSSVSPSASPQPTASVSSSPPIAASPQTGEISSGSNLKLANLPVPVPSWFKQQSLPLPTRNSSRWGQPIAYSPTQAPQFIPDPQLQSVVDDILKLVKSKSLSTKNLSIVLIDASTNKFGGYNHDKPQFPASVAKIFWLAALEGQIQNGMWNHAESFKPFINKMMKESDNDSSSVIIDMMTDTQTSKVNLNDRDYQNWLLKRKIYINSFFQQAGYQSINVTQKTYPIPYLELQEPKGNELQVRLEPTNPAPKPIRNQVSAIDAARLIYEICHSQQAVSPESSKRMCGLLKKDIKPKSWQSIKKEDFNPIETFFGEPLSFKNTELFSKAGWTPNARKEVAMIRMLDRQKEYILAVFVEDPKYGNNKTIFPEISKLVYRKMHDRQ